MKIKKWEIECGHCKQINFIAEFKCKKCGYALGEFFKFKTGVLYAVCRDNYETTGIKLRVIKRTEKTVMFFDDVDKEEKTKIIFHNKNSECAHPIGIFVGLELRADMPIPG